MNGIVYLINKIDEQFVDNKYEFTTVQNLKEDILTYIETEFDGYIIVSASEYANMSYNPPTAFETVEDDEDSSVEELQKLQLENFSIKNENKVLRNAIVKMAFLLGVEDLEG